MRFSEALNSFATILQNGPLGTRLKYDYQINQPGHLSIQDELGRQALEEIYRGDIDIAQHHHLPIIINAPTFRASKNHLPEGTNVRNINLNCIDFIKKIRNSYQHLTASIFISGSIGSMYDAYSFSPSLTVTMAQQYNQEQINAFVEANVDLIFAVTISSVNEALGIVLATQGKNIDCIIGFFLNQKGTLQDGSLLHEAIAKIDNETHKSPLGYLATCVHASTLLKLDEKPNEHRRFIGFLANGSNLAPQELNQLNCHIADTPKKFADDLKQLKNKFGFKILSGCCGTTNKHLFELAEMLSGLS